MLLQATVTFIIAQSHFAVCELVNHQAAAYEMNAAICDNATSYSRVYMSYSQVT